MGSPRHVKVMFVLGTRPEAIKVAPLVRAMEHHPYFTYRVVSSDQHSTLLDSVSQDCGLTFDAHLNVGKPGSTVDEILTRTIAGLDNEISTYKPDLAVVHGDTTTTLAGALADFNNHVPLVHLEAGLRTGDLTSPFPEEANRRLVAQIASLHLAPTHEARDALIKEGVNPDIISVTGNTAIDSLAWVLDQPHQLPQELSHFTKTHKEFILVTAHRRESWGAPLDSIAAGVARAARQHPRLGFLLPLHPNPRVREAFISNCSDLPNVLITEPAGYRDFSVLMSKALAVLTDSGGVQEEAPAVGTPVGILRDKTERTEIVKSGQGVLLGNSGTLITHFIDELVTGDRLRAVMTGQDSPFGDGYASERSLGAITAFLDNRPLSATQQWEWAGQNRHDLVENILRR